MGEDTLEQLRTELDTLAERLTDAAYDCLRAQLHRGAKPAKTDPDFVREKLLSRPVTPSSGPRRLWPRQSAPERERAPMPRVEPTTSDAQPGARQQLMALMSMRSRPCERRSNSRAMRLSSRWSLPARSGGSGPVRQIPFEVQMSAN